MTKTEGLQQFDVLYNSITSNQAPGLDDYEKSVLLDISQEQTVKGLYNGKLTGESFEKTEELRRYLNSLIRTKEYISDKGNTSPNANIATLADTDTDTDNSEIRTPAIPLNPAKTSEIIYKGDSIYKVKLPEDVLFIIYEKALTVEPIFCSDSNELPIVPVRYDEWHRIKQNPFRRPNKRRAVRLDDGKGVARLESDYTIKSYTITYMKRPESIQDRNGEDQLCELDESLHRVVLQTAVELANNIYKGTAVQNK